VSGKCPACNSYLKIHYPLEINQQVVCSDCGLKLEVIWLYPLELEMTGGSKHQLEKEKGKPQKTQRDIHPDETVSSRKGI
jgi:lysine biosynthesis protein LysW